MQSLKNELGNIVLRKDGNMISTTDVKEAKDLVGKGYSVFINKSGSKISATTKKTTKK